MIDVNEMSTEQLFDTLVKIVDRLGWSIAVPSINSEDEIPGLIIGNNEYLAAITDSLPEDLFDYGEEDIEEEDDLGLGLNHYNEDEGES